MRKLIKAMKATQIISVITTGGALTGGLITVTLGLEATSAVGVIAVVSAAFSLASKIAGDRLKDGTVVTSGAMEVALRVVREITGSNQLAFPRLHKLEASKREALGDASLLTLGKICGDRKHAMTSLLR